MKEFLEIFRKVDGKNVLKQYLRTHVLAFALIQTALLGKSRKSLEIVRLAVNNKIYKRLKKQNQRFIEKYKSEEEKKITNENRKHNPIIWTIWLQGMENAPDIVKKCYESMKKNITDREIIVITEENFEQYVKFPSYIMEKYKKGIISKVHFADLLRIELLAVHGGTWLDGTVYCSSVPKQKYMLDSELFLFQMLKPGLDGHSSAVSSWLMTAYSNNPIICLVRALLYNYWQSNNYTVDYFILHDFFQMAIETYPEEWKKVVPFDSSIPHILLLRLFDQYNEEIWEAIKCQISLHKLSYKFEKEKFNLKGTYYEVIFGKDADIEMEKSK